MVLVVVVGGVRSAAKAKSQLFNVFNRLQNYIIWYRISSIGQMQKKQTLGCDPDVDIDVVLAVPDLGRVFAWGLPSHLQTYVTVVQCGANETPVERPWSVFFFKYYNQLHLKVAGVEVLSARAVVVAECMIYLSISGMSENCKKKYNMPLTCTWCRRTPSVLQPIPSCPCRDWSSYPCSHPRCPYGYITLSFSERFDAFVGYLHVLYWD